MRLIDADELLHVLCTSSYPQDVDTGKAYYIFKKELKNAPTVDAVEVVRCKECKHRYVDGTQVRFNVCELTHNRVQNDDWFCADGEKVKG